MHSPSRPLAVLALAASLTLGLHAALEAVTVQIDFDKAVDFKPLRSWAWDLEGSDVVMARTQEDDAPAMRARAEPIILDAVATEMMRLGLPRSDSQPDLTLSYHLILTTNMTAQTMGQFLPGTTAWAVPPFAQSTTSLKMMNQGALVLVMSAKGEIIWRGLAQAKVAFDADNRKREAVLREGVRDMLKRYPPKQ
jgi:hypothetical protein